MKPEFASFSFIALFRGKQISMLLTIFDAQKLIEANITIDRLAVLSSQFQSKNFMDTLQEFGK